MAKRKNNPSGLGWLFLALAVGGGLYAADRVRKKRKSKPKKLTPGTIEPSTLPLRRFGVSSFPFNAAVSSPQFVDLESPDNTLQNIALVDVPTDVLISLPSGFQATEVQTGDGVEVLAGDLTAKDFLFRIRSGSQEPFVSMFIAENGQNLFNPLQVRSSA